MAPWRIVIVKYVQNILRNKRRAFSKKKNFGRSSSQLEERYLTQSNCCSLPISSKEEKIINRSQVNRLRTQLGKGVGGSGKSYMTRETLVKVTAPKTEI